MNLSEQIREAALFDTDSDSLGNVETHILYAFADIVSPLFLDDIETRTFMLLVAEALASGHRKHQHGTHPLQRQGCERANTMTKPENCGTGHCSCVECLTKDAERFRWLAARHDGPGAVFISARDDNGNHMNLSDAIDTMIATSGAINE